MNIINNAFHALSDHLESIKGPKIAIKTKAFLDRIVVENEDSGPKIPPQIEQKYLNHFSQQRLREEVKVWDLYLFILLLKITKDPLKRFPKTASVLFLKFTFSQ